MFKRKTMAALVAAAGVAAFSAPAFASSDVPGKAVKAAPSEQTAKPLSAKARKMVWCVAKKDDPTGAKECKTREKWIAEGRDPFGKY